MELLQRYFNWSYNKIESYKYKTSITGKIANDRNTKEVEFSVPLRHGSNFCRTSDMPLSVKYLWLWLGLKIVFWQIWQQKMQKETIQQ